MQNKDDSPKGPISRSVLAALNKEFRRKVVDFESIKMGARQAEELERGVITESAMTRMNPLHAVYAYAQNKLSVLVEKMADLPMCAALTDAYAAAEDEYLPSGPPMSPLTVSYFFCWAVFDSAVGQKKETFGTVAIDLCRRLGVERSLVRLFECLQDSRMGLFTHEGMAGGQVLLREFVTGKQHRCVVPSGYGGRPGEIWFARVLPPPFEKMQVEDSLVFTTPYVLCREEGGRFFFADPKEWGAFLERAIFKTGIPESDQAYAHLLKYGLSRNYWNDFVFEAYVNHQQDMILLAGLPDVELSRPHARARVTKAEGRP
jgi:hypothetical protein